MFGADAVFLGDVHWFISSLFVFLGDVHWFISSLFVLVFHGKKQNFPYSIKGYFDAERSKLKG